MAINVNTQGVLKVLEKCADEVQGEMLKAAHTVLNEDNNDKIPEGWYDKAIEGAIERNITQNKPKFNSDNNSFEITLNIPANNREKHIDVMMEVLDDGNEHLGDLKGKKGLYTKPGHRTYTKNIAEGGMHTSNPELPQRRLPEWEHKGLHVAESIKTVYSNNGQIETILQRAASEMVKVAFTKR